MKFSIRLLHSRQLPAWRVAWFVPALLFIATLLLPVLSVLGDGCFVLKWNKAIDINEPTQKAIIVHDAGREDLLLQVRYEGPLEEFGWLIPVPGLPKVEKGSMEPFYELSKLTQEEVGASWGVLSAGDGGTAKGDAVRVIEVKTVGAYDVAVLSARDADSLRNWLRARGFSLPAGREDIVDGYLHKGWYFVAAKVKLGRGTAFREVSSDSPRDTTAQSTAREAVRKPLAVGELHPLRISFDTPECIFPLRISAVGGKPSEVSLYVLSAEPLLNQTIFTKKLMKTAQRRAEWEQAAEERSQLRERCMHNSQLMQLAWRMYPLQHSRQPGQPWQQDWSIEDLEAISREGQPNETPDLLDDSFYVQPEELPPYISIKAEQIPQSCSELPRLKGREWWLTKQVWMFSPEDMEDLVFRAAVPFLAGLLPSREGQAAASVIWRFGERASPALLAAACSTNSVSRVNASSILQTFKGPLVTETLLELLHDESPHVRLNALMATTGNWDTKFLAPVRALLRDPHSRIRYEAVQRLRAHESKEDSPFYLGLLENSKPDVQTCALMVLGQIAPEAIPRAKLVSLLSSPRFDVASLALTLLQQIPNRRPGPVSVMSPGPQVRAETNRVSSVEVAALTTNQVTLARLMGLKVLYRNADAHAISLTLPLLQDTNRIVRNRAFELLKTASGQDIPQNEPAKWEQWWTANRATFKPPAPAPQPFKLLPR